jgi:uncharacterized protein DUF6249
MQSIFMSPFSVAVAGCLMILGIAIFGIYSEMDQRRVRSQERMTLLARGMSIDDIERLQRQVQNEDASDPVRTMNNIRRTAMILFGCGAGIIAFGLLLAAVLQNRVLLIVPAAGLIPVAVGLGFWIDYRMQARDLARFGLEVDTRNSVRK